MINFRLCTFFRCL